MKRRNWSGHLDFLSPKHSILLDGELGPVDRSAINEWIIKESKWFNVNYSNAALKLYQVFNDYSEYAKKSKTHATITKKNFSLKAMQDKLVEIIEKKYQEVSSGVSGLPKLQKIQVPDTKPTLPKLKKVSR